MDPTSKKCIFLGYQTSVKGYRLWDPIACKLIVSRDDSFNEPRLLKEGEKAQAPLTDNGVQTTQSCLRDLEPLLNAVEGEMIMIVFMMWKEKLP